MVVLFKEEDLASHLSHPSCESNPNREESITPTIHQRLLEPRSSNHKYLDHDDVACAGIDIADAREERNSNLTAARLSTKCNHSDGANVAESELNSRAEMYHLVLCNSMCIHILCVRLFSCCSSWIRFSKLTLVVWLCNLLPLAFGYPRTNSMPNSSTAYFII